MPTFQNPGFHRDGGVYIEDTKGYKKAEKLIRENKKVEDLKGASNEDKFFILELLGYLKSRKDENRFFSFEIEQIENRANIVENLINAIKNRDNGKLQEHLQEKNIKVFKGFFSKRLYNMLVARREGAFVEGATKFAEEIASLNRAFNR